jgi:hypothetical protein
MFKRHSLWSPYVPKVRTWLRRCCFTLRLETHAISWGCEYQTWLRRCCFTLRLETHGTTSVGLMFRKLINRMSNERNQSVTWMHYFPSILLWFIYQNVSNSNSEELWNNTRRYEILHIREVRTWLRRCCFTLRLETHAISWGCEYQTWLTRCCFTLRLETHGNKLRMWISNESSKM